MSSSAPTATTEDTPTSCITLKEPLIDDVTSSFQKMHEFKQIQHDNPLDISDITCLQLWEAFLFDTIKNVKDCLVKKIVVS